VIGDPVKSAETLTNFAQIQVFPRESDKDLIGLNGGPHMRTIYCLLILMAACGRDEGSKGQDQASPVPTYPQVAPQAQDPAQNPQEDSGSWFAATDADIPVCNTATIGRLVYVQSTGIFKACGASGYSDVQIKGKDAVQLAKNEWIDPVTGKKWLLGGSSVQMALRDEVCTGVWSAPGPADLQLACQHGIFQVYQGQLGALPYPTAWVTYNVSGVSVTISNCLQGSQNPGTYGTAVCIAK